MFRTTAAAAAILGLTMSVLPAAAADESSVAAAAPAIVVPTRVRVSESLSRPRVLPALYASYAALQVYDVYATRQGLASGAREANPVMRQVVGNQGAFWALKASATVGTIVAAERLWKQDKKAAAIAVLVASNGVAAFVAVRNARTLRQGR